MAMQRPSIFRQAWQRWKSLQLPWRSRFLAGQDLAGNTYWLFRERGSQRWRRIVKYPRSTPLYDVEVPPLWHQWLRHTRADPPSVEEQVEDVARQERMRILAAQADARWEAKARVVEAPEETKTLEGGSPEEKRAGEPVAERAAEVAARSGPHRAGGQESSPWSSWERAREATPQWQPERWKPGEQKRTGRPSS